MMPSLMSNHTVTEISERLNAIARLRLLFNTAGELNAFTGFNTGSSNPLSRIGGDNAFIKDAVYDRLCRYVSEQEAFDLDSFLSDYRKASEFYARKRLSWLSRKGGKPCCDLLSCVYGNAPLAGIKDEALRSIAGGIYDEAARAQLVNVPILVLVALKLLPLYGNGRGDVKDIAADLRRLLDFLRPFAEGSAMLTDNTAYCLWEKTLREDAPSLCRISLYAAFCGIMENYVRCTDRSALYRSNLDLQAGSVFPMGDNMWFANQSEYWRFASVSNGYFALRYRIDRPAHKVLWARFEMVMYDDGSGLTAYLVRPGAGVKLMRGRCLDATDSDCFDVTEGMDGPSRCFSFSPLRDNPVLKLRKLTETAMDYERFASQCDGYVFENEYPETEYNALSAIAAITPDDIFIPDGAGAFYKVPKHFAPVLQFASVDDNGGLYEIPSTGERIIGFIDQGVYINVTTEADLVASGVEKVGAIGY